MTSDQVATEAVANGSASPTKRRLSPKWIALIVGVIVVDILAFMFVPPVNKANPGEPCPFPVCVIVGGLEFPAPHNIVELAPAAGDTAGLVTFHPAISNTLFTMWIVMILVVVGSALMVRGAKLVPGRGQNFFEWFYEFLGNFGLGIAGEAGRPYLPIFLSAFLLIVFNNWIGLVPPVGKTELLRAPSSDVNITLGMALVAFVIFEFLGFWKLGVLGYLGKFFPLYEFKKGIGAGIIALFVGLIELMLEFVKPVTLSFRLFGNIYGGEVALGVITSLTIAIIPVGLLALELMLNAIQALIFSVLTLIFIVLAIESHHEEEGHIAEDVLAAVEGHEPAAQPSHS
ncbi:MAG TPA: FoF1 ATP synthase subunit a [Candidatus Limnocylindrales bacterium]|nr:FoF1 ATP synthase subunit a [Candidatus Limnocylindrales bacterium]